MPSTTLSDSIVDERKYLFSRGSKFERVDREDIVGIDNILDSLDDIIDWLRDFDKYRKYDTRLEPGIVFEGLPGSGKTLCSRYIAGESRARFINVRDYPLSGAAITAKDISDLFTDARNYFDKTNQPVILFWDEFEGVAKTREKISGIRDESTASQLTAELDGVNGKCPGLLLIGCTNYFKHIDKALLRPGRMGVHISFRAPDREGKKVLLQHYLNKYDCEDGIDVDTASFFLDEDSTAAKIEEVSALVWRRTVTKCLRNNDEPVITSELLNKIMLDDLIGDTGAFSKLSEEAVYKVAVHELGHAIVAKYLNIPIRIITVRPHGDSYGRVITYTPDFHYSDIEEAFRMVSIGLGSIEAEWLLGLPPSTHSESDTEYATSIVRQISEIWGDHPNLARLNPSGISRSTNPLSDALTSSMDQHIVELLEKARLKAEGILVSMGKDAVEKLAKKLVKDETWTGEQFDRILDSI